MAGHTAGPGGWEALARCAAFGRCGAVTITGAEANWPIARRDSPGAALAAEQLQAWASNSRQGCPATAYPS